MATSVVPAVLAAFVALLDTLDAEVVVGPLVGTAPSGDYIQVGAIGDDGEEKFNAVQRWASTTGAGAREEDLDITCYADSWSGDTDRASVMGRLAGAYALVDQIEDLIDADVTLGGVVRSSATGLQLTGITPRMEQSPAGFAVGVVFHIEASRVRI